MRHIDLSTIILTPETVFIYQELYYESYKPLVELINPNSENRNLFIKEFSKSLQKYNWTMPLFEAYLSIDFMQRIVYDSKFMGIGKQMKTYPEYSHLDPNNGALRLKCPRRTESPDPIHYN